MRVVGTRVNASGKTVEKKQCDLCRRATRYARMHGVALEEVLNNLPKENCEICDIELQDRTLSLDHNHETGELRGWLCPPCNSGLGHFRDNPELMKKAIDYLYDRGYYGK